MKWNGTVVTLACGSRDTARSMASGGLVVEDAVPEAAVLAVGQQDADLGLAVGEVAGHQLDGRSGEPAVGAVGQVEGDAGHAVVDPGLGQLVGPLVVEGEVHGPQLVGHERAGVLDGPGGGQVEAVDEHEHDVAPEDGRGDGLGHVVLELVGLGLVLAGQPHEEHDHQRDEGHDDPGAMGELGDGDDDVDHQGHHRADTVDDQTATPARLAPRRWWRAMPAWESVNEVKTPMA